MELIRFKRLPSFPKNFPGAFFFFLVFFIFWARGVIFLDPDFGWHLRMGNLILSSGIPETDPFSYTMPSFSYVDHEWLTNILIAWFYPKIGFFGLAGIFAVLALGSLFLSLKILKFGKLNETSLWFLEPTFFLLAAAAVLPFVGVRPQIISWFFLALFLKIFYDKSLWKKWHWFLLILLILWSNLHGGFPLGLLVIFFLALGESLLKKKLEREKLLIIFLGGLGTLINPYGIRLWGEIWQTISDTSLRWTIAEWQPSLFDFNPAFLFLIVISSVLIYRFRRKLNGEQILLYLFFFFQAISSLRHQPLWVITSLPIITQVISLLSKEVKKIKFGAERFNNFFYLVFWFAVIVFSLTLFLNLNEARFFREKSFYPAEAVNFLKSNPSGGEIFSDYGWGGYLIWKLPEKKVFIDGRMPSWRGKERPPNESNYAMRDYSDILGGKVSYEQIFSGYRIKTVLWPQPRPESFLEKLDKKFIEVFLKKEPKTDFFQRLIKDGWVRVYQDAVSVVLQKLD